VPSRPEVRRRSLTGVRRSPEGERAAVEPARGSALSQDPGAEPLVVAGERWCRPQNRSPMRDAHPRVSAPPLSRLAAVPFCGDRSQHATDARWPGALPGARQGGPRRRIRHGVEVRPRHP
jgi:hypothetical protein